MTTEEINEYPEEPMGLVPRDLHEMYMSARAETFMVKGFASLYHKIYFLIDIGKEMLPDTIECLKIKRLAEELLKDPKAYPRAGQMEHTTGGCYRISTGGQDTGLIEVRHEDISHGRDEAKEQKATTLLPRLKNLDNMIFKKLVEYGIVDIKKPKLEDLMTEALINRIAGTDYVEKDDSIVERIEEDKTIEIEEDGDEADVFEEHKEAEESPTDEDDK